MGPWSLLALALVSSPEQADPLQARIRFIEQSLVESESALRWWYDGWLTGYTALTFAQALPAVLADDIQERPTDARSLRAGMVAGAATSAIGAVALLLSKPSGMGAVDALGEMPETTSQQRQAKLARAEALLRAVAEEEAMGVGWIPHVANLGINLVAGLALWLGYDLLKDGLVTFVSGSLVGAVQIFTQPTRAIDDWAEYRRRYDRREPATEAAVSWHLSVAPGGVGFSLAF